MIALQKLVARSAWLILGGLLLISNEVPAARAQDIMLPGDVPPRVKKRKPKPDVLPLAASQSPSFAIPVGLLGYGAPSPTYLGRHYALFSLDFLDDRRLLFTFRAPGLLSREGTPESGDRQMKAVVLNLPEGTAAAQTVWTLPDRGHYLWMLGDGRFLLRDRDGLKIGGSSLETKLLLPLSGQFQSLQVDPEGRVAVVHTLEHAGLNPNAPSEIVTRVVELDSGKIQQTTRSSNLDEHPINSEGTLEVSHDNKYDQWSLKLTAFTGGAKILGHIESTCLPVPSFVSESVMLVAGCDPARVPKFSAVSTDGRTLWQEEAPLAYVAPLLVTTAKGVRFVRESVVL